MAQLRKTLAYNLREKRHKCGFTQSQLAEKVDVSTHHIAMIEIARSYPTLELAERIADALGIEVYELFVKKYTAKDAFQRLHDTYVGNIKKLIEETIKEAIAEQCRVFMAEKHGPNDGKKR